MMHLVRSQLLLAAVAIAAALYGFATPALAHGGHNALPVAHTSQQPQTKAPDTGKLQANGAAEIGNETHHNNDQAGTTTCCGLSCMTAVPQHNAELLIVTLYPSPVLPPLQPELLGRGPNRLDRPPTV
jgi:hypothetical protein